LYIDNPCGAGYSYGNNPDKYPDNAMDAMKDVHAGLLLFFSDVQYKQYLSNDLYVMGESYGGKYTLALSTIIDQKKQKGEDTFNLKGLALGNAWVHPVSVT
jgi:carboxypeptidase C (cathepsin A)